MSPLISGPVPASAPARFSGRCAPQERPRSSVDDDAPTTRGSRGTVAARLFTPLFERTMR